MGTFVSDGAIGSELCECGRGAFIRDGGAFILDGGTLIIDGGAFIIDGGTFIIDECIILCGMGIGPTLWPAGGVLGVALLASVAAAFVFLVFPFALVFLPGTRGGGWAGAVLVLDPIGDVCKPALEPC